MKNPLIGIVLESLLKEYNSGACDNLSLDTQDGLLESLAKFKDEMEDKLDKVLTIEEASLYLNVTRLTLRNYVKEGKLHPKKHKGGVLEFNFKELKLFINQFKN